MQITRQSFNRSPQHRALVALGHNKGTRRQSLLAQTPNLKNRQRLKRSAFYAQPRNRFLRVCHFSKGPDDAAPSQLNTLGKRAQLPAQASKIIERRKRISTRTPHSGLRPATKESAKLVIL